MRSLTLDVRYDEAALARIPQTGPVVFVANHPYGVLDGIVISWLVEKVRPDFLVLTNAVLMRAQEVRDYILPIDFSDTPGGARDRTCDRARRRARSSTAAARWWCFRPAAFRRRPIGSGGAGGRRALAALRRPAHPALEGDGRRRSGSAARTAACSRSPAMSA